MKNDYDMTIATMLACLALLISSGCSDDYRSSVSSLVAEYCEADCKQEQDCDKSVDDIDECIVDCKEWAEEAREKGRVLGVSCFEAYIERKLCIARLDCSDYDDYYDSGYSSKTGEELCKKQIEQEDAQCPDLNLEDG
jgi:hypothetical protein